MNCLKAALARVAMQDDILEHNDGVINDQADSGGQPAEGHEIERLAGKPEDDESDEQCRGNHQACNKRGAPVTQEENEDDGRK